jgi:hypothetical protein
MCEVRAGCFVAWIEDREVQKQCDNELEHHLVGDCGSGRLYATTYSLVL